MNIIALATSSPCPVFRSVGKYQIEFFDCKDQKTRLWYEEELQKAGAKITEHKINFTTNVVRFYLHLEMPDGHTLEGLTSLLRQSPIWHLTSWAANQ